MVLYDLGGLGKTELVCVLAHIVSPAKAFHFVNKVDRIRDVTFSPGEALVVDEACFAQRDVDDAKALVPGEIAGRDLPQQGRPHPSRDPARLVDELVLGAVLAVGSVR